MATWQVGSTLQWGLKVYDTAGDLADLGGGDPTATITLPDGTTTAGTVTNTATGTYSATLVSTQSGRHSCVFTGSGANSGGLPVTEPLDVWPADGPRQIISLADARDGLNMASGQTVNDDELRGYIVAAGEVIDHLAGAQLSKTITDTWSGNGSPAVMLSDTPTSVTSVTENGTTLTADTDYCWDENGILWRGSRPYGWRWSDTAPRNVVVTFVAGTSVLPESTKLAAALLVRHWWLQTQQSARPFAAPYEEPMPTMTVAGYAVPNMVVDLLRPAARPMPGIA